MKKAMGARIVLCCIFLSIAEMAWGQDDPKALSPSLALPFTFNFTPPGARSLGMGGSFLAIADDATASEANPAGLTILSRPEVSVHGRQTSADVQIDDVEATFVNDFVGALRQVAQSVDPSVPDFVPGNTFATFDESESSVSFASFVQPVGKWAFSIYYLENVNFLGSSSFDLADDVFIDLWSSSLALDSSVRSIGASAAYRFNDAVALGVSVRNSELRLDSSRELRVDYFGDFEFETGNLDHTDFISFQERIDGSDRDLTYNIGLLLHPNQKLSLGLVYKRGGDFAIDSRSIFTDCVDLPGTEATCDPVARTGSAYIVEEVSRPTRISLPNVGGLGFAWRPLDNLTIAADINRISYSNLNPEKGFQNNYSPGVAEPIKDQVDFHLGLEYTHLMGQTPLSLRAGVYTDRDHEIFGHVDSDQTHITAGFGTVLGRHLQVDLAGDFADSVDTTVLSLVYRF